MTSYSGRTDRSMEDLLLFGVDDYMRREGVAGPLEAPSRRERLVAKALKDLQDEVKVLEAQRGTSDETLSQKALILAEEIFEIVKVLRVQSGIRTSHHHVSDLADELADVLFVSCAISNRISIDLTDCWTMDPEHSTPVRRVSTLDAALDVSECALNVFRVCRSRSRPDSDSPQKAELARSLGALVSAIDRVARHESIDITRAIDHKLRKDQLRLWN